MQIRIEASGLPGRSIGPGPTFDGADNVHVGVQRKDRPAEMFELRPGDVASALWTLECSATPTATGVELNGPYIQNGLGGRFVYLSWGTVDAAGVFAMFRRAKLMFAAIDPGVIEAAVRSGCLTARLRLSDSCGHPLCGAVRPPLVEWLAHPAP
ncbi:DUF5990 family protein [Streptomyces sp. H27-D2]|uniref:DUF5990 family protein n=1 Tax=Streptomyces sp. H27-D2 TaxID=3046304 RepID=UPI002DB70E12|nr:DUF5990 family protein [Streptomyces sp. H27-D2]MEC4015972.1 DUF5990 family protein [Streptomyces sp. H27-D2]